MILDNLNWTAISAIATIVAAIAAILPIWRRKKRVIQFEANTYPLVQSVDVDGLSITYCNQPVTYAHVTHILFRNTGNTPIMATDYAVPLTVLFPEGTTIIRTNTGERDPALLSITGQSLRNVLTLNPVLLNRNDVFDIYIFTVNGRPEAKVGGHIVGGKIEVKPLRAKLDFGLLILGLVFLGFSALSSIQHHNFASTLNTIIPAVLAGYYFGDFHIRLLITRGMRYHSVLRFIPGTK